MTDAHTQQPRAGSKPRFAVVVPAYNASATIRETLDGMLSQEFRDWECVVVDDGSTDDTAQIVESYSERDGRIRLVRQANTGTAGAYRAAIDAAASDLLVICAADDYLLPAHLRVMDQLITQQPDYEIYSSNGEFLYEESGLRRPVYRASEWAGERSLTIEQVIEQCFYSVGVVIRRATYELAGGHRLGVYVDDFDLWLRAMARGARHRYTPHVLSVHRVSDFQQSANLVRLYESNIEVFEHLMATVELPPELVATLEAAIATNRERIAAPEVGAQMEQQARRLHRTVQRIFGDKYTERVLKLVHSVSWIVRPLREKRIAARKGPRDS